MKPIKSEYLNELERVEKQIILIDEKYKVLMSKTILKFQKQVKLAWEKELDNLRTRTYRIFKFQYRKNFYEKDLENNPKLNFNQEIIAVRDWKKPLTEFELIELKIKNKQPLTAMEKWILTAKSWNELVDDGTINKLLSDNKKPKKIEEKTNKIIIDAKNNIIIEFFEDREPIF